MNRINETRETSNDPLIDEVRAIRKAIGEEAGEDFDKLGEYLRKVGQEFRSKTGRFAFLAHAKTQQKDKAPGRNGAGISDRKRE